MVTLDRAWCILCALTARKPAHGHGHGHDQKAGENEFWRKLRHKSDCCCFGWAVYAPWACYMNLRALYNPKRPKSALTCQADLAADQHQHQRETQGRGGGGSLLGSGPTGPSFSLLLRRVSRCFLFSISFPFVVAPYLPHLSPQIPCS